MIWLALAASVLLAAVIVVTPRVVPTTEAEAVVSAGVICIAAGWLAMIPPIIAVSSYPDYLPQAGLASITLRMLLTLMIGMAYLKWAEPPRGPFTAALVAWYLILLVVETGATVILTLRSGRANRSGAHP